jgi:hypothetical protein
MLRSAALALSSFLIACGPPTGSGSEMPEGVGYPTVMRPPSELGADFVMEQEVTMVHPNGEHAFRAVLQKRGDELLLLGLAGHGGRAFSLKQTAEGVEFERFIPIEFPFPPEYILHDVHRTWFVDVPPGEAERDGERVVSTVDSSGLIERTFERLDGAPAGVLTVRYEGGLAEGAPQTARPPSEVVVDNAWFGYRATVRTLSWQAL